MGGVPPGRRGLIGNLDDPARPGLVTGQATARPASDRHLGRSEAGLELPRSLRVGLAVEVLVVDVVAGLGLGDAVVEDVLWRGRGGDAPGFEVGRVFGDLEFGL